MQIKISKDCTWDRVERNYHFRGYAQKLTLQGEGERKLWSKSFFVRLVPRKNNIQENS